MTDQERIAHLTAQVTRLQARGTELLEEARSARRDAAKWEHLACVAADSASFLDLTDRDDRAMVDVGYVAYVERHAAAARAVLEENAMRDLRDIEATTNGTEPT